ncbi:hypothetical protein N7G274_001780 [Stereocaulon virgatum]|uniref:Cytochrome P450 n=1 Tax=Stereocaulon virgatum TaxID=373712 RepID=A0ABR4AKN9_9LECA
MPGIIKDLVQDTKRHEAYTMALIDKNVETSSNRPDYLTRTLEDRQTNKISNVRLAAHASDFVAAGSEPTATVLSCITCYLLKIPNVGRRLLEEIRAIFKSCNDINAASASSLPYLHAVALEGTRIYAPLPLGPPRIVLRGGDTVDGHFLPAQ